MDDRCVNSSYTSVVVLPPCKHMDVDSGLQSEAHLFFPPL